MYIFYKYMCCYIVTWIFDATIKSDHNTENEAWTCFAFQCCPADNQPDLWPLTSVDSVAVWQHYTSSSVALIGQQS